MNNSQKKFFAFIIGLIALVTGIVIFTKPLKSEPQDTPSVSSQSLFYPSHA